MMREIEAKSEIPAKLAGALQVFQLGRAGAHKN
jgi:hypothetical protein